MGLLYLGAHGYIAEWRKIRAHTTLCLENIDLFDGRAQPELLGYCRNVALYGVRPLATSPPVRSVQQPNSSVRDNQGRTASDLWDDMVKGRIVLFTNVCADTLGPLMESRLAFVAQKDKAKVDGMKARYISDPMVGINERIEPKHRARVRVPKHGNVIRMIWYWDRRCATIPRSCANGMRKGPLSFSLCQL